MKTVHQCEMLSKNNAKSSPNMMQNLVKKYCKMYSKINENGGPKIMQNIVKNE